MTSCHENIKARRERVAEYLTEGMTNKEIAQRLDISTATLGHDIKALLVEHGVGNRVALAVKLAKGKS